MAQEELMQQLPSDIERVAPPGPFFIRDNHGSYSVVVLTKDLVTCGGVNSRVRAENLACDLNKTWSKKIRGRRKSRKKKK